VDCLTSGGWGNPPEPQNGRGQETRDRQTPEGHWCVRFEPQIGHFASGGWGNHPDPQNGRGVEILQTHWTCELGSENRDRGGIEWYSEPTSPAAPLLKIDTNYEGCWGFSNALKISSGGGGEHCKKSQQVRPEMMQLAQNKSDFRCYCILKNYVKRAFWTYKALSRVRGPARQNEVFWSSNVTVSSIYSPHGLWWR